jgi:hypothetical protein
MEALMTIWIFVFEAIIIALLAVLRNDMINQDREHIKTMEALGHELDCIDVRLRKLAAKQETILDNHPN